jgi:hypothetical protein
VEKVAKYFSQRSMIGRQDDEAGRIGWFHSIKVKIRASNVNVEDGFNGRHIYAREEKRRAKGRHPVKRRVTLQKLRAILVLNPSGRFCNFAHSTK